MGYRAPNVKFCRLIEKKLGLPEKTLTSHFGRRSGAVALADAGCTMLALKRAGRWASNAVAEGYISHSKATKKERAEMFEHGEDYADKKSKKRERKKERGQNAILMRSAAATTKISTITTTTKATKHLQPTTTMHQHQTKKANQLQNKLTMKIGQHWLQHWQRRQRQRQR